MPAAASEMQPTLPSADAPRRARVVPLSATQHLLKATVSEEFVRDLDEVRAALGHKLPGGSLEAVLHECLRVTLAVCRRRRRGAGGARPAAANDHASMPAAANDSLDGATVTAAANDNLDGATVTVPAIGVA